MEPPVYYISKCFFLWFSWKCYFNRPNHSRLIIFVAEKIMAVPVKAGAQRSFPSPRAGRASWALRAALRQGRVGMTFHPGILREFHHDRSLFEAWKSSPKLVAELFRLMEYSMIYTENWDIFWTYHVGNSPSATIGDEYLSIKHRESTIEGIVPVTWWWIIQEMVSMVRVRWFHQIEIGLLDQWRTY